MTFRGGGFSKKYDHIRQGKLELVDYFNKLNIYKTMFKWQMEVVELFLSNKFGILGAATGSGKSIPIKVTAYKYLKKHKNKVAIIIPPMTSISKGFEEDRIIIDGEEIDIIPSLVDSHCTVCNVASDIYELIMEVSDRTPVERILVITQMAMVNLFNKLQRGEFDKKTIEVLRRAIFFFDEAHHIGTTEEIIREDDEIYSTPNGLASVVEYLVENNINTYLITATFFRGDKKILLKPETMKKFEAGTYFLPFHEYLATCKYLRNISFGWFFYGKGGYYESIRGEFKKAPHKKTIVFVPPTGSVCSMVRKANNKEKAKEVQRIIKNIAPRSIIKKELDEDTGCKYFSVNLKGKRINVAELLTTTNQRNTMKFIASENKKSSPCIDVIIAMNMFREGADYRPLERVIIIGPRGSAVEIIQGVGRSFRDYLDKESIESIQLLPDVTYENYKDKYTLKEVLRNNLKVLTISMAMEEMLEVEYETINSKKKIKGSGGGKGGSGSDSPWIQAFSSECVQKREDLLYYLLESRPFSLERAKQDIYFTKKTKEFLVKEKIEDSDLIERLTKSIIRSIYVLSQKEKDICVDNVSNSKEFTIYDCLDGFYSKALGCNDFREIRNKALQSVREEDLTPVWEEGIKKFGSKCKDNDDLINEFDKEDDLVCKNIVKRLKEKQDQEEYRASIEKSKKKDRR